MRPMAQMHTMRNDSRPVSNGAVTTSHSTREDASKVHNKPPCNNTPQFGDANLADRPRSKGFIYPWTPRHVKTTCMRTDHRTASTKRDTPQDIPEVQFAGYHAEMLCAPTVIRQHTIGMLNEGQCQGFFLRAATNAISRTNTCTFGGLITRAQSGQRP